MSLTQRQRSSRKYAVTPSITPSPLARDSTTVIPLRLRRKDSFSTAQHTHGLGGDAKDAMLRSNGLRMRRTTSSLRIIATKGNATLTAGFTQKVFVPELEIYLRDYRHKEEEFAESIPSAVCPFQFIQQDTSDIVPFHHNKTTHTSNSSTNVNGIVGSIIGGGEIDPQKMREWLKDMRLKVHMRLVQRHVTNGTNPTEGHKQLDLTKTTISPRTAEKKKGPESERKKKGPDSDRKKGGDSDRKKGSDSDRRKGLDSDRRKSLEVDKKKKGEEEYDALEAPPPEIKPLSPPAPRKQQISSPPTDHSRSRKPTRPQKNPTMSRVSSQGNAAQFSQPADSPLFQSRKNPTLIKRTHSEYDVKRVRIKARNSVGFEPLG